MLKLGKVVLGRKPQVVVCLRDRVSPATRKHIRASGIPIVELRIDQFSSFDPPYVLNEIRKYRRNFSVIATIRSRKEGGGWKLSEARRFRLYESVLPKVDAVDIELSSTQILKKIIGLARKSKTLTIVSYHHFQKTPGLKVLQSIVEKARREGAAIVKIATFVRNQKDLRRLATLTATQRDRKLVTIALGPDGVVSRVLFPLLGSLMTYASAGKPTGPGQLDYRKTLQLLQPFHS